MFFKRKERKKASKQNFYITEKLQKMGFLNSEWCWNSTYVTLHVPLTLPTWPPDQHISGDGHSHRSTMTGLNPDAIR